MSKFPGNSATESRPFEVILFQHSQGMLKWNPKKSFNFFLSAQPQPASTASTASQHSQPAQPASTASQPEQPASQHSHHSAASKQAASSQQQAADCWGAGGRGRSPLDVFFKFLGLNCGLAGRVHGQRHCNYSRLELYLPRLGR